jgi:hypothetical protein
VVLSRIPVQISSPSPGNSKFHHPFYVGHISQFMVCL